MKDTTGTKMTCSRCGKEIGGLSYVVDAEVLCPDCYCKTHGVCR